MTRSIAILALAFLAGCATAPPTLPDASAAPEGLPIRIACEGVTLDAWVGEASLTVELPNGTRKVLPQAIAASGVRYVGDDMLVWTKGYWAMVEMNGKTYTDCVITEVFSPKPWDEARARGAAFRGIGNEPGWTVEIIPGDRIVIEADYGERHVTVPDPGATIRGEQTVYHAVTEAHDVRLVITHEPCHDVMSGERFEYSVHLTIDGQAYHGCGRRLAP